MSRFLQRLVARSQPTSARLGERAQSVRPRIGSRFEPAMDVTQVPAVDVLRHEDDAVSGESPAAPKVISAPDVPDAQQPHDEPARTISPPQSEAPRPPEPPTPMRPEREKRAERTERVDETIASDSSQAQHEPPAPTEVRPRQQPARSETEPPDEERSSRERRSRPAREAQPAQSVQPMQTSTPPPPERTETVVRPAPAAEEIIRTVRIVQETLASPEIVGSASASTVVQPASDEQRPAVRQRPTEMQPPAADQSVTLESQTPPPPDDSPRQPVRPVPVRAERSEESVRPQVPALAPAPMAQQHSVGRRQPAESPTIKVTIGRIEVRAEQPSQSSPTQTRRQPARRTPALTLDDYLRKRNEGGR